MGDNYLRCLKDIKDTLANKNSRLNISFFDDVEYKDVDLTRKMLNELKPTNLLDEINKK